jgi:hypothetical protein
LIESARTNGKVIGVSGDDLLAPWLKRRQEKHNELRTVLRAFFGISLEAEDFMTAAGEDGEDYCSMIPLNLVSISESERLMVITCNYEMKDADRKVEFPVAPDSVTFHLFEYVPSTNHNTNTPAASDL